MTGTEILQSKYMEVYTPAAGQITSANTELKGSASTIKLKRACFMVTLDSNITFVTEGGDTVTTLPVKAMIPYPILVKKITANTAGTVFLLHSGETDPFSNG